MMQQLIKVVICCCFLLESLFLVFDVEDRVVVLKSVGQFWYFIYGVNVLMKQYCWCWWCWWVYNCFMFIDLVYQCCIDVKLCWFLDVLLFGWFLVEVQVKMQEGGCYDQW